MKKMLSFLLCLLLLNNFPVLAQVGAVNQNNISPVELPVGIEITRKEIPLETRLKESAKGYIYKITNNSLYPVDIISIKNNRDPVLFRKIYNIHSKEKPIDQALEVIVGFLIPDPYGCYRSGSYDDGYITNFLDRHQIFFHYVFSPVAIVVIGTGIAAGTAVTYTYFKISDSVEWTKDNIINNKIDREKAKFTVKPLPITIKSGKSIKLMVLFHKNSEQKLELQIRDNTNKLYKMEY